MGSDYGRRFDWQLTPSDHIAALKKVGYEVVTQALFDAMVESINYYKLCVRQAVEERWTTEKMEEMLLGKMLDENGKIVEREDVDDLTK